MIVDHSFRPVFLLTCVLVVLQPNTIILGYPAGLTLYLSEALTWAVFLPVLAWRAISGREDPIGASLKAVPEILLYCSVAAFMALVTLGLDGESASPGKVKNILSAFALICLVCLETRDKADVATIVLCVILAAAANAALGILQVEAGAPYVVEPHENNVWKEALTGGGYLDATANGFFDTPNALGISLAPVFVIACRLVFTPLGRRVSTPMLVFTALLIAGGLAASAHRGALLWAFVGLTVALLPLGRKTTVSFCALMLGIMSLEIVGLYGSRENDALSTLTTRSDLERAALHLFASETEILLIGNGDAAFELEAARYADWALPLTHNAWLDQILFFGVLGLAAYILLWVLAFLRIGALRLHASTGSIALHDGLLGAIVTLAGLLALEPRADGVYSVGQVFLYCAIIGILHRHMKILLEP